MLLRVTFGRIAGLLLCISPEAQEEIRLEWAFKHGLALRFRITETNRLKENPVKGANNHSDSRQSQEGVCKESFVWRFEVRELSDSGIARVAATCESAQVEVEEPAGGKLKFDSGQKKEPPRSSVLRMYHHLPGSTLELEIDRYGAIQNAKVIHWQVLEKLSRENAQTGGWWDAPFAVGWKSNKADDHAWLALFDSIFRVSPQKAVRRGGRWSQVFDLQPAGGDGPARFELEEQYECLGAKSMGKDPCLALAVTSQIHLPSPTNVDAGPMRIKKESQGEGEICFSADRGVLLALKRNLSFSAEWAISIHNDQDGTDRVERVERHIAHSLQVELLK